MASKGVTVTEESRPRVVISRCLGFAACRWDGEMLADACVERLSPHVDCITVCPEMEIGLGVPREPIRIESLGGGLRLFQPATGRDLTREMRSLGAAFMASLAQVDGFLLKARSPSCGPDDAKIHSPGDETHVMGRGPGLFAASALAAFPDLAVESEEALRDSAAREHYLTRIFASARLRDIERRGAPGELIAFHARNELLLAAHERGQLAALRRVLAAHGSGADPGLFDAYRAHFLRALSAPARASSSARVLARALKRLSPAPTAAERDRLHEAFAAYRARSLPWSAVRRLALPLIARSRHAGLREPTFFSPYPEVLSPHP